MIRGFLGSAQYQEVKRVTRGKWNGSPQIPIVFITNGNDDGVYTNGKKQKARPKRRVGFIENCQKYREAT